MRTAAEATGVSSLHCPGADQLPVASAVLAVDEHVLVPGGGFDWHADAGVHLLSWVLAGAVRFTGTSAPPVVVSADELYVQSTGSGTSHRETAVAAEQMTRLVQVRIRGAAEQWAGVVTSPTSVGPVTVETRTDGGTLQDGLVFVGRGCFRGADVELWPGDVLRVAGERVELTGSGAMLVLRW